MQPRVALPQVSHDPGPLRIQIAEMNQGGVLNLVQNPHGRGGVPSGDVNDHPVGRCLDVHKRPEVFDGQNRARAVPRESGAVPERPFVQRNLARDPNEQGRCNPTGSGLENQAPVRTKPRDAIIRELDAVETRTARTGEPGLRVRPDQGGRRPGVEAPRQNPGPGGPVLIPEALPALVGYRQAGIDQSRPDGAPFGPASVEHVLGIGPERRDKLEFVASARGPGPAKTGGKLPCGSLSLPEAQTSLVNQLDQRKPVLIPVPHHAARTARRPVTRTSPPRSPSATRTRR